MTKNFDAEELLNALSNRALLSLVNDGDGWTIYYEFNGAKCSMYSDSFDNLMARWIDKVADMDSEV